MKIVASLDCLISLARSSTSLGETSCRPIFVEGERSVLDFTGLRHPCMASRYDKLLSIIKDGENLTDYSAWMILYRMTSNSAETLPI